MLPAKERSSGEERKVVKEEYLSHSGVREVRTARDGDLGGVVRMARRVVYRIVWATDSHVDRGTNQALLYIPSKSMNRESALTSFPSSSTTHP
jgi:hypothetical protein